MSSSTHFVSAPMLIVNLHCRSTRTLEAIPPQHSSC